MSRLVVVLPLTPLAVGESFAVHSWPLHVTVLPPFATDAEPQQIAHTLASASAGYGAITAIAAEDALFGRRENIAVTLVRDSPELTRLHRTLVAAVLPFAALPEEPAFTGSGFRAHVTVKDGARVSKGDVLSLTHIALVDMAPRSHPSGRTVLATVDLAGAPS